ncbi:hypothetical protein [Erythrobacter litoralis]|nr:hypothetical protein [Erythrobacter litoralis]
MDDPTDRCGCELRIITRKAPDGTSEALADFMIAYGDARRYYWLGRQGWC